MSNIFSGTMPALMTPCKADRTPDFDALVKKVPFICLVDGMENDHLELKKNGYPYVFDFNSNLRNIFHVNKDNDFRDTLKMYVEYSGDNATKQLIHFLKKI